MKNTHKIELHALPTDGGDSKAYDYIDNNHVVIVPNPKEFENNYNDVDISFALVDFKTVFNVVNSLGRDILKYILKEYKNEISNGININLIVNKIGFYNNEKCIKDYEKWIDENVFPYSLKEYGRGGQTTTYKFIEDCLTIALFYEIHIKISEITERGLIYNNTKDDNLKNLIELLDLRSLSGIYDSIYTIEEINDVLNSLPISSIFDFEKNKNKIDLLFKIRMFLIEWVSDKIDNEGYFISRHTPIPNRNMSDFFILNKANNIMAVAYYQLLINMSSVNTSEPKRCKNYAHCFNYVTKEPNMPHLDYCKQCRDAGIPRKIANKKHYQKKHLNKESTNVDSL